MGIFSKPLPPPKEKAKQLKEKFGDKALDVIQEIRTFGYSINLREELMYWNKVEQEIRYSSLSVFISRLKKIGIEISLVSNVPWLYISEINGKKVKEKHASDHGYVLGYQGKGFTFEDLSKIFNLIRKYV